MGHHFLLVVCNNKNVSILYSFRGITTFIVHVVNACDIERCFTVDTAVKITGTLSDFCKYILSNTCYISGS